MVPSQTSASWSFVRLCAFSCFFWSPIRSNFSIVSSGGCPFFYFWVTLPGTNAGPLVLTRGKPSFLYLLDVSCPSGPVFLFLSFFLFKTIVSGSPTKGRWKFRHLYFVFFVFFYAVAPQSVGGNPVIFVFLVFF